MEDRARLRTHPERSVPGEIPEVLSGGKVAHVGFVVDGQPYVIPMLYHYVPGGEAGAGILYLHGARKGRIMGHLSAGARVCVTVTHLDQLLYSKTALDHSANYRSAVCFGTGRLIEDPAEKNEILEEMVARYFEGRTGGVDYQHATPRHLKATTLVEVVLESASAKARRGPPNGPDDDDSEALGTAGLLDVGNA